MAAREALPADNSIFSGGLAGLLAASVFGGPVGAAIGLGTGLLSNRMHRSELDLLADDYEAVNSFGSSIQDQIKATAPFIQQYAGSDPTYMEQLDSISQDVQRSQELAQHYDPEIRRAGLQQLTNVGARMDALHKNLQTRTQELTDAQTAQEEKMREHFQSEFENAQSKAREGNALADQAMRSVNDDTAVSKPETKAVLMKMLGVGPRDVNVDAVGASVGIPGLGINMDFNNFNPSYDDAVKMIETYRATQIKASTDYAAQVVQLAHQNGFGFEADKDGKPTVKNIGSVVQNFLQVKPSGAPSGPPTPKPDAAITNPDVAASPLGKLINKAAEALQTAPDMRPPPSGLQPGDLDRLNQLPADVSKMGSDAVQATREWIQRNRRKNWKRPTNQ